MATIAAPTVHNDATAAHVLQRALNHELRLPPEQHLILDGWPTIKIRLTGPVYDGTITAATAKALLEIQRALDRAYLRLVRPDGRRLNEAEKSAMAVTATVDKGSSLVTVDLSAALTRLATDLVTKMSPEQIVITVLGLGMLGGATVVAKQYVKSRAEKAGKAKELETQVALSEQETKRLQIMAEAKQRQPMLKLAQEDFDQARDEVLRSAYDAKKVNLDGVTLTGEQARGLSREPRELSEEVQLNGVYLVSAVSWSIDGEDAMLALQSMEKSLEFRAALSTRSLLQQDKDLLAQAGWDRTPVYLSINARVLRGEVTKATVVGFDWEALRNRDAPSA